MRCIQTVRIGGHRRWDKVRESSFALRMGLKHALVSLRAWHTSIPKLVGDRANTGCLVTEKGHFAVVKTTKRIKITTHRDSTSKYVLRVTTNTNALLRLRYLELFPALVDLRSKPGILFLTVRVQPLGLHGAESFSSTSTIRIEVDGLCQEAAFEDACRQGVCRKVFM